MLRRIQHEDPIYQLSAFLPPENCEAEFLRRCPGCLAVRWEPRFLPISCPRAAASPTAWPRTLAHLGLDPGCSPSPLATAATTLPMLEYAGIGVAMGNACDDAKAAADYVTDDITADGLAKALAHFGLI